MIGNSTARGADAFTNRARAGATRVSALPAPIPLAASRAKTASSASALSAASSSSHRMNLLLVDLSHALMPHRK